MGSKGTDHHGEELWPDLQGQALGGWGQSDLVEEPGTWLKGLWE